MDDPMLNYELDKEHSDPQDYEKHLEAENESLRARVAELESAIQAWNDATDFDEHTKAVRVLQGLAKG